MYFRKLFIIYAEILAILIIGFFTSQCFAANVVTIKTNENFEEVAKTTELDQIKINTPPRRSATPKDLHQQTILYFQGRNSETGAYTVWSHTFTDYNTKIVDSYFKDGKFYVEDNTGKVFQTGEHVDTSALETDIQNNTTNINNLRTDLDNTNIQVNKNTQNIKNLDSRVTNNTERLNKHETQIVKNANNIKTNAKNIEINRRNIQTNARNIQRVSSQVQTNTQNINALHNNVSKLNTRVDNLQSRVDRLDNRLEQGLATVSALAGLHPNPRHQGRTQVSVAAGMYADNVAGAVGVFHYVNDRVMLSAGASYGGDSSFAGNVGITIGF